MTVDEFNKKYEKYIEPRFDGLEFYDEKVIEYLDKEFEEEIKTNPNFNFAQIKLKFGMSRVYATSDKTQIWEQEIDKLLK